MGDVGRAQEFEGGRGAREDEVVQEDLGAESVAIEEWEKMTNLVRPCAEAGFLDQFDVA